MIIDHTLYTLKHEKVQAWMSAWEQVAGPLEQELLGGFLGMFTTEIGPSLSDVLLIRAYASMDDRERRLARLRADPRWRDWNSRLSGLAPFVRTHSRLLKPTAFSPRLAARQPD